MKIVLVAAIILLAAACKHRSRETASTTMDSRGRSEELRVRTLDGRRYCRPITNPGGPGDFGRPPGEAHHCLGFSQGIFHDPEQIRHNGPRANAPYKLEASKVMIKSENRWKDFYTASEKQLRSLDERLVWELENLPLFAVCNARLDSLPTGAPSKYEVRRKIRPDTIVLAILPTTFRFGFQETLRVEILRSEVEQDTDERFLVSYSHSDSSLRRMADISFDDSFNDSFTLDVNPGHDDPWDLNLAVLGLNCRRPT